jgi:hypothetical protein
MEWIYIGLPVILVVVGVNISNCISTVAYHFGLNTQACCVFMLPVYKLFDAFPLGKLIYVSDKWYLKLSSESPDFILETPG